MDLRSKILVVVMMSLAACICGCKQGGQLAPIKYVNYLEAKDNGYVRTIVVGKAEYKFQLATPEYYALKTCADIANSKALEARIREIQTNIFFIIHVKIEAEKTQGVYAGEFANYYNFEAQQDLRLFIGDKELAPDTYLFENNYGLADYNTILVGFKADYRNVEQMKLSFNDRYTRIPSLNVAFTGKELKDIPVLVTN